MRSRRSSRVNEDDVEETRIYRRRDVRCKSGRKWLRVTVLTFAAVLLLVGGVVYGMWGYFKRLEPPPELVSPADNEKSGRINILALGIDGGVDGKLLKSAETGTRSDVMILVSIDPQTKEVGVLSIPRDTRVFIPKVNDFEKIAHAHAYGGPDLSVQTVEEFLGVKIDGYVRVDFEGFKKLVDILGGVEINVPEDMNYDDPAQNLHIHLKAGDQVLDGEKALEFVRYRRYVNGDIDRIKAQEQFLKAVLQKALSVGSIAKIPAIISQVTPYVVTNLTSDELLYLAKLGLEIKPESVKMAIVPGTPAYISDGGEALSYWVADKQQTAVVVDELIRGIDHSKTSSIKVAVQNGCGIQGAADYLASILRSQGFNVVSVGNASRQDYKETRVMGPGNSDNESLVLNSVLPACSQAKTYKTNDLPDGADVLVIIGKDFKHLSSTSGT